MFAIRTKKGDEPNRKKLLSSISTSRKGNKGKQVQPLTEGRQKSIKGPALVKKHNSGGRPIYRRILGWNRPTKDGRKQRRVQEDLGTPTKERSSNTTKESLLLRKKRMRDGEASGKGRKEGYYKGRQGRGACQPNL